MNRARQVTLLVLAVLVIAFVVTWLTIPNKERRVGTLSVAYPARVFASGMLTSRCTAGFGVRCSRRQHDVIRRSDVSALERRVKATFGGAAAVVVLVGLAFGAGARRVK